MPVMGGKCSTGPVGSPPRDKTNLPTFVRIVTTRNKWRGQPPHKANALMEAMAMGNRIQGEVCLLQDSPFRILRAAESGNVDLFGRLYKADPGRLNLKDNRGRTATHQAAERNKTQILRFVFAHGGDINVQDKSGNTPLHVAVEHEALDSIGYLIQLGANTSILNDKKMSALHLATEMNKLAALNEMAKYKDSFNTQLGGDHGRTALHLAAIHDHDECARILVRE
ncbi:hypothetical protein J437_LFUL004785 [Ladona fulva]|uniref:Uncharacterized protein n=1 Tax=Ladona fulva TaxID=123851 RepID=A0A8K0K1Y8_LADFU|nr:hypothetical protein J437_LFUL004785 [Ladona fulva]